MHSTVKSENDKTRYTGGLVATDFVRDVRPEEPCV